MATNIQQYSTAADELWTRASELETRTKVVRLTRSHSDTQQILAWRSLPCADNAPRGEKETFADAVKQEPDYPIYHYRTLRAPTPKWDNSIPRCRRLQTAWKLRKNLGENERFPDPRQDDSFKNYLNDPKFQETVQNMVF